MAPLAIGRRAIITVAGLLIGTVCAFGQAKPPEAGLTGTLAKVARTGTVTIAHRDASVPFAFLDRAGRPIGYSIDLCGAIVEEIGRTLGRADLKVDYLPVTSEGRLPAVIEGRADLECGSTTANLERSKSVSFSPLIFVAGTRVMVPKGTRWRDFHDLRAKKIAVTAGTTNVVALKRLTEKFALGTTLVEAPDHEQSFRLLVEGKVDGFATDDVLLSGLIARHKARDRFTVVGELLSYDPYGIVYRHDDPAMKRVVERAFRILAVSNEIDAIYEKWFGRRLPGGETLGIPMSPQLEESFRALESQVAPDER